MSDHLVVRLMDGVVEREKRWQGDTHEDLGGSVDYDATDKLMAEAAAELTRLRTAASGDLIPLADHKLAVALAYQKALALAVKHWEGEPEDTLELEAAILALADTDALAEVEALKAERDDLGIALKVAKEMMDENLARAEAAEAEVEKWQRAFAAQTRKLQVALDVGGDAVRAAIRPKAAT